MTYFYSLVHAEKNLVSGFVEFDDDIKNANDGQKAFDNFTRDNCALTSFSKL